MTNNEKRRTFCPGCEQNFYNGNNPMGVKECWHLPTSRIVHRVFVGSHWMPPHDRRASERTLDCCRRRGFVAVDPKSTSVCWKEPTP